MPLSRRAFVAAAGGALAAATASIIWKFGGAQAPAGAGPEPAPEVRVDEQGWILTAEEQEKVPHDELADETR